MISFDFAITSYCQAKCRTCPRTNNDTGDKVDWLKLTHQDFTAFERNTSAYIDSNEISFIKFCGQTGDPMMHPHITKFVDHAAKIADQVVIATNGGLRSERWYTDMGNKHGDDLVIVFGIDGMDHDTNWKYREGVDFNKAYANMSAYALSGGAAEWDFLVFEWNYHQIPEIARMAKELNVPVEYKINTQIHGLLNPDKLQMVEEMICQASTI